MNIEKMASHLGDRLLQEQGVFLTPETLRDLVARAISEADSVTAPMTRVARKKLEQMGATAHGALVRNEAGAWAAVSEAGRVMWLDGFEEQLSGACVRAVRATGQECSGDE